jgi:hypothetical protein
LSESFVKPTTPPPTGDGKMRGLVKRKEVLIGEKALATFTLFITLFSVETGDAVALANCVCWPGRAWVAAALVRLASVALVGVTGIVEGYMKFIPVGVKVIVLMNVGVPASWTPASVTCVCGCGIKTSSLVMPCGMVPVNCGPPSVNVRNRPTFWDPHPKMSPCMYA